MPPRPDPATLQHPPPFKPHPLTQLRAGRIKKVFGKTQSAIYKAPLTGPVAITNLGIPTDEHAFPAHGGLDKALLHYCSAHYDAWKKDLPGSAHLFNVGGFGENVVSATLDEKTVCIGDKISIGEVLVEVSEPRNPCYNLNHRFEDKSVALRSQTLFRTGWMYRILRTGTVAAGDMIALVERPFPEWTVARVQYYLYMEKDNREAMTQLTNLAPLGEYIKSSFRNRLLKGMAEDQSERLHGVGHMNMHDWNEYRIVAKRRETSTVTAFVLEAVDALNDEDVVPVQPGSHVRLKLGGKLVRAYSVVSGTSQKFELGIALDAASRGASSYLHTQTHVGDILSTANITASFPLAPDADKHIFIAGGIGITAFLAALQHLRATDQDFELHFAVAGEVPFQSHIAALSPHATIYNRSLGQRLSLSRILARTAPTTHIYTCGPPRLQSGVRATAATYDIPASTLHFEEFTVTTSGDPFTAELKESKKVVQVGAAQSLLDALRAVGLDVDSSCEVGNCGTCRVGVCEGRVEHKGTGLAEGEREGMMLSCVSRGVGRIVLDL
ncbi:3-chlorobenzoate-3,4-dioxygenase reductase subunit [Massariosphaeria phaeospora]|uniref:3-chlorobenzoate-3,4-dioxygenase reductase subunit n=1 Tax=Massariosphaeria phaeospora TaxID=100035 RepID=A0A7C8M6D1_9PLEO|nr:3-chlorobenzoate-3,4-dioxygenase reductase subunit [Massariosphaeria phaeospora]